MGLTNKKPQLTRNIAKKGFIYMQSSSPASISFYLDSDVLRNPFQSILPHVSVHCKKRHSDRLTKEFLLHKDRKEK